MERREAGRPTRIYNFWSSSYLALQQKTGDLAPRPEYLALPSPNSRHTGTLLTGTKFSVGGGGCSVRQDFRYDLTRYHKASAALDGRLEGAGDWSVSGWLVGWPSRGLVEETRANSWRYMAVGVHLSYRYGRNVFRSTVQIYFLNYVSTFSPSLAQIPGYACCSKGNRKGMYDDSKEK